MADTPEGASMTDSTSRETRILSDATDARFTSVTDAALDAAKDAMARIADDLSRSDAQENRGAALILEGLTLRLSGEQEQRAQALHAAEIEVEANGHGIDVFYDQVREERDGTGWYVACTCSHWAGYMTTRAQAVEIAAQHAWEHDGKWEYGRPSEYDES